MANGLRGAPFTSVSMLIFVFASSASYTNLSVAPYRGCNLFQLLHSMAATESNIFGRRHSEQREAHSNYKELSAMTQHWVIIVIVASAINYAFVFVAHGKNVIQTYLNVDSSPAWNVLHIAFLYLNISWLIPVAIVRISSIFLERRILSLVEYLETTDCNVIDVPHVMGWYEDLYQSNMQLSRTISPLVTQCIVLYFSLIVFLLQVMHPPCCCHSLQVPSSN